MDYIHIHDEFIKYFQSTSPRFRLEYRHPNDIRLLDNELYLENHHIIPKSQGGSNALDNLVLLLPEEHIFIHYLRYKAFNTRTDMLAYRFCLNGVKGNKNHKLKKSKKSTVLNKVLRSGYAHLKHESSKFRLEHGWHTSDGASRISKARTNTMPVKDFKTNEMIGSVDVNHEKVLSGEWVHHSKGTILSQEERNKRASPGEKNGRYSGQKDENLIEYAKEYYSLFKIIPTWNKLIDYVKLEYNIQLIKSLSKFRFNYNNLNGNKGFIAIMENITGDTHDSRCSFNCFNITKELIEKYKKGNN